MRNFRIKAMSCLLLATMITACAQNNDSLAIAKIKNYLAQSEKQGLSGALLIAKNGKILLNEGFGYANKQEKIKNTSKTVFDVGSVSKQFTAAAILKLEEQGKLSVANTIGHYFKNVPKDKQQISIHHLLTHTAGFVHDIGASDFDQIPTEEYFDQVMNSILLFTPGKKHEYTNVGYSILARIIELVSGQSYEEFMIEHLFKPAGMYATGYVMPEWNPTKIAQGYTLNVENKGSSIDKHLRNGNVSWCLKGNGGIQSTQEDMYKWYVALSTEKILSEASLSKLTKPYVLEYEGETSYYAYGWAIFKTARKTKMIAHDGSDGTFFYDFRWFPKEKTAILYANNALTSATQEVAWEVDRMLFDSDYTAKTIAPSLLSRLFLFVESYKGKLSALPEQVKAQFGKELNHPYYLNRMCGIHLRNGKLEKALVFGQLNVSLFPNNANNWDTLGEVYYAKKDVKKSLRYYKKALSLDANLITAKKMIVKLEKEL